MYCQLKDISGHAWEYYFDRLVIEDAQVTLFDIDGFPVTCFPVTDIASFHIE